MTYKSQRRRRIIASTKWFNVPNLLTLTRFGIAIPAGLLLASTDPAVSAWGVGLFLLAGITDLLDGWIARAHHLFTDLGKMLDPVADKLALASLFAALSIRFHLPGWFLPVYIGKEFVQLAVGALLFRSLGRPIAANIMGKIATILLYSAAAMLYFGGTWLWKWVDRAGQVCLILGLVASLVAGANYLREALVSIKPPAARAKGEN